MSSTVTASTRNCDPTLTLSNETHLSVDRRSRAASTAPNTPSSAGNDRSSIGFDANPFDVVCDKSDDACVDSWTFPRKSSKKLAAKDPKKPLQRRNSELKEGKKVGLYKTELCRSWEETGTCRYGNKCQFAHSVEEIRPLNRHPKYKTEMCRTFWDNGTCPYGKRCCFIHTAQTPAAVQENTDLKPTVDTRLGIKSGATAVINKAFEESKTPQRSRQPSMSMQAIWDTSPRLQSFSATPSLRSSPVHPTDSNHFSLVETSIEQSLHKLVLDDQVKSPLLPISSGPFTTAQRTTTDYHTKNFLTPQNHALHRFRSESVGGSSLQNWAEPIFSNQLVPQELIGSHQRTFSSPAFSFMFDETPFRLSDF